jgi:hypothetical protein
MIAVCMLDADVYASILSTLLMANLQQSKGLISPVGRVVEQGVWAHHSNVGYSP